MNKTFETYDIVMNELCLVFNYICNIQVHMVHVIILRRENAFFRRNEAHGNHLYYILYA